MMKAPVVHADGTITVLLESDGNEYDQTELIRLSMDGNVISRKTLVKIPKGNSGCAPEWPGVFSGGYVIATFDLTTKIDFEPIYRYSTKPTYQPVYHWFDFDGNLLKQSGDTSIFIYPGYKFKIPDAIITNFHLPQSTLIMLISAFAGKDNVLNAYSAAVKEEYRFFSFGDAMFIE